MKISIDYILLIINLIIYYNNLIILQIINKIE